MYGYYFGNIPSPTTTGAGGGVPGGQNGVSMKHACLICFYIDKRLRCGTATPCD